MARPILSEDIIRTINFEVKQFCSTTLVNTDITSDYDIHRMAVRHMLRSHMATIFRKVTVTAPATRADALRELLLPKWTRRWFPVRYRDLSAEAYAMLPHLDLEQVARKHEVRFAIFETPRYWMDQGEWSDMPE
jgi:hypothetical protein